MPGKKPSPNKRKGHIICPNCNKETDFILRRGEALIWCRRCRCYFRVVNEVEERAPLQQGSAADVDPRP